MDLTGTWTEPDSVEACPVEEDDAVPDHERFRGYGVMALPFDSGHVLGLRVMPHNDYAPFEAIWHRTPEGRWSMYVDGPHHEVFCPRLFGPVLQTSGAARISVTHPDAMTLRVDMVEPRLEWTVRLRDTLRTRIFNRVLPHIPFPLYRRRSMLAATRALSKWFLGLGEMDLEGSVPGGQRILVKPEKIHLVEDSRAILDGRDLGRPSMATENPRTGAFRWPARGIVAHGEVRVAVDDPGEYRRRLSIFHPNAGHAGGTG